jgi:hypothetical protein
MEGQPINNQQATTQPLNETPVVGSPPQDRRASDAGYDRRMSDEWGKYQSSSLSEMDNNVDQYKTHQRSLPVVSRSARDPSMLRPVLVTATLTGIT